MRERRETERQCALRLTRTHTSTAPSSVSLSSLSLSSTAPAILSPSPRGQAVREGLKATFQWPTYPQLYLNGKLIGGLDIMKELQEEGELAGMLAAAGAVVAKE